MVSDTLVINLNDPLLKEIKVYTQFRNQVNNLLLDLYYAGVELPVSIRGTQSQVETFFNALRKEKNYMDSYMKYGLDDSVTLRNRHKLDRSVHDFERETGLKWPFKN